MRSVEHLQELLRTLEVRGPLPTDRRSLPLGAAWLADERRGIDLGRHDYLEHEYLVSGLAETWTWDERFAATATGPRAFTTRVLVRRPRDPEAFSGGVQLEPHHPDDDRALTWAAIAPWIVRGGHAHVGFTQEPATVPDLIDWDPDRYRGLELPDPTSRWDIAAQLAVAIRAGLLPDFAELTADRVVMSGWSMTGTFCRTFLGEGFHARATHAGMPAVSGYVICISSGGAGRAGYASLSEGQVLPAEHPRRRVGGHGVPIIELLSEGESETHLQVLRDDSDDPADPYRLYQVAGTGHLTGGRPPLTTNGRQRQLRGAPRLPREIVEPHSDSRMDLVARAVFEALDRWIVGGTPPQRASRFSYGRRQDPGTRGVMPESLPLRRDRDGNVVGGLRTPWVEVPSAAYLPHSTPMPGRCQPAPHAPYSDPRLLADLVAHMEPFSTGELAKRYGGEQEYLQRFEAAARRLASEGWLLDVDLPELIAGRRALDARV